jgi:hypothetical protein
MEHGDLASLLTCLRLIFFLLKIYELSGTKRMLLILVSPSVFILKRASSLLGTETSTASVAFALAITI